MIGIQLLKHLCWLLLAVCTAVTLAQPPQSAIIRLAGDGNQNSTRWGHLLGLQGLTTRSVEELEDGETKTIRTIHTSLIFNDVAVFLGYKHFNERRGDIIPHLPALLKDCDFYFTYESRDTTRKALYGAEQLIQAMTASQGDGTQQGRIPFAYFGAHLSSVSKPLSTLGAAFDLPQISGASTSSELDASPSLPVEDDDLPEPQKPKRPATVSRTARMGGGSGCTPHSSARLAALDSVL